MFYAYSQCDYISIFKYYFLTIPELYDTVQFFFNLGEERL